MSAESRRQKIATKHARLFFEWLKNDGLPIAHQDCHDCEGDRCELSGMVEEAILEAMREASRAERPRTKGEG
jgi:hypothetical protein